MPQLIKIRSYYRQLVFSYPRKEELMEQSERDLQYISARVIQRAYRQRLFQKKASPLEEFSSELKQSMLKHSICESPAQLQPFSEFTPQYKMQWAQNARADLKPAAVMLMKYCVMYRSHAKFTRRLAAVVQSFNQYLYSLPKEKRDYILVAPNKKGSNQWVIGLALPLLIKKPMAILHPEEIRAFKAENGSLTHMVFIDDALYSGRQMSELVVSSQRQAALNTILIVPYYTDRSLACFDRQVQFVLGERMLRYENLKSMYCKETEEPWTQDTTTCDEIFSREWSLASSKVGTFFNHKIADDASTYLRAGSEKSLASFHSENKDPLERFRLGIRPPY